MVTVTPDIVTEKERRYGIGYKPVSPVSVYNYDSDSIFMPEKRVEVEIERRITVPQPEVRVEVKPAQQVAKKEEVKETEKEKGLSFKSKFLVGLYVFGACILSALAMIAGLVIGDRASEITALESQVRTASAIVRVQEAQIDELSSVNTIERKATENGMVKSTVLGEVELLDVNEEQAPSTNGFDIFCDWFSGVIGG